MTKPEKRWQLLLVADDGRIIPFRHIRGIALTLVIITVMMGLTCAGLGWLLSKEKIRSHQTLRELVSVRQEAARYKSENEIITTELVLAEARMEKAGLPVPNRPVDHSNTEAVPSQAERSPILRKTEDNQEQIIAANETRSPPQTAVKPSIKSEPAILFDADAVGTDLKKKSSATETSRVAVGEIKFDHNASNGRLVAAFRVNNTGSRSSSVEGWCAVALKRNPADADTWMGLPNGVLADGKFDFRKGKNFKISSFVDMSVETEGGVDPASFTTATVYIVDDAGLILLEKDFPMALKPEGHSTGGDNGNPSVVVSGFNIRHDTVNHVLQATFKISNAGPRSSPVAGRCVVVLKSAQVNPGEWLALPDGAIVDGKPDMQKGRTFKISRFMTMEMQRRVDTDPSVFSDAVVTVFGMDGTMLLQKAFSINLGESM